MKRNDTHIRRRHQGVSLVEVLVSLLIIAVGVRRAVT
jgi:prepilin-type N-terminal cleavage/methylation domain-containing protein